MYRPVSFPKSFMVLDQVANSDKKRMGIIDREIVVRASDSLLDSPSRKLENQPLPAIVQDCLLFICLGQLRFEILNVFGICCYEVI